MPIPRLFRCGKTVVGKRAHAGVGAQGTANEVEGASKEATASERGAEGLLSRRSIVLWVIAAVIGGAAAVVVLRFHQWKPKLTTLQGAVMQRSTDPRHEAPIAGAIVTASREGISASTQSDNSGYFRITFPDVIWPGQAVELNVRAPDYRPLNLNLQMTFRSTSRRLIIAELRPVAQAAVVPVSNKPPTVVSNIRIRYTVNAEAAENVGSLVRTFQTVNQGDVPCRKQSPCSPDGDWKAATGSVTLDAGLGNEFRDVRASCIAGPCPFTRINRGGWEHGGRTIVVTATDWSDTATFLLEAEVFHTTIASNVRESYPVIFDRTVNFTLPPTQEGVSIEAEINGEQMVFPVGPDVYLDWATCTVRTSRNGDKSTVYQCALKPGYAF